MADIVTRVEETILNNYKNKLKSNPEEFGREFRVVLTTCQGKFLDLFNKSDDTSVSLLILGLICGNLSYTLNPCINDVSILGLDLPKIRDILNNCGARVVVLTLKSDETALGSIICCKTEEEFLKGLHLFLSSLDMTERADKELELLLQANEFLNVINHLTDINNHGNLSSILDNYLN
jgi:hypothetical protein